MTPGLAGFIAAGDDARARDEVVAGALEALGTAFGVIPDRGGKPWLKVSEKGAVSVYGMGRFPVTLYKEQWLRLLAIADEIKAFITANDERLKSKES